VGKVLEEALAKDSAYVKRSWLVDQDGIRDVAGREII